MKILMVTEDLPVANLGGAGKHAVLLANTLMLGGHQVEMLGRRRSIGVLGNNEFGGVLHCDIDLRGTGWQEYRFGAFLPGRREHAARRIWQAIRRLGEDRFDIIHYHGHCYGLGAIVPAHVPFVQTLHDQGSECITMTRFKSGEVCQAIDPKVCAACATPQPNALQRTLSAAAVTRLRQQSATAFARHETIFVSEFLRSRFVAHVRPDPGPRANVVHNFTSAARLRAAMADAAGADRGRPVVLMVGRIDAAKGFGQFLDAVPDDLLQRWQFRVVGDGPQRREIELRHSPRGVQFAGPLSQLETYRETARAGFCVVPSVCEESCSTSLLEALALGRLTFALRRGGTPELVRYQLFPQQLRLFPDIAAMVAALGHEDFQESNAAHADFEVGDGADVRHSLAAILDVYTRASRRSGSAPRQLEAIT